jgi:hypothetical protein
MHSRLTQIDAQQHVAELHRTADHRCRRGGQAATTASRSEAPIAGRPVAAALVTLIHRLRRRLAPPHPAAR